MEIEEAFGIYFKKLENSSKNDPGSLLRTVYVKGRDLEGLYVNDSVDQYGYVEWRPVHQKSKFDFSDLETEFGFVINERIKRFFNSYWFVRISGNYNGWDCSIDGNFPNVELGNFIRRSKNHGDPHCEYMNGNYFCLGDAESEEYGYGALYCNNSDASVIVIDWDGAYDCDFSRPVSDFTIKIADSIETVLSNLEV